MLSIQVLLQKKFDKGYVETLVKINKDLPSGMSLTPIICDIDLHMLWSWDEFFP